MQPYRCPQGRPGLADTADVIEVRMRQQDPRHARGRRRGGPKQLANLVAGIHEDAFTGPFAGQEEAVLEEGRHCRGCDGERRANHVGFGPIAACHERAFGLAWAKLDPAREATA